MRKFDIAALLLVAGALVILLYKIDKPFWGQFDWTGAWFGTIARNYLQIDLTKTKLAPITVAGTENKADWEYYNHYPITYPFMVAGSMAVFGDHEWSIRLVSLIFSLLTLGAFYLLCRRFFHPLVGIFGIISILATPMFIYYGKLPVHEQPVLFFSLMGLYFYLAGRNKLMTVFLALAFMASWTGAYIFLLITVHRRRIFIPVGLIFIVIILLHFSHIYFSSDLKDFSDALANRTSGGGSPIEFVIKQIKWFFVLYTKPLALVSLLGLVFWRKPVLLMFFVWGFFQWVAVNRIMWIHDYMLMYFLPFVALSCGLFFYKLFVKSKTAGIFALLSLLTLSLFLSLPFTKTLLNSQDQTAKLYFLGRRIREHTAYGDRVFVPVPDANFEIHYPKHYLSYYANRFISYVEMPDSLDIIRYEKK